MLNPDRHSPPSPQPQPHPNSNSDFDHCPVTDSTPDRRRKIREGDPASSCNGTCLIAGDHLGMGLDMDSGVPPIGVLEEQTDELIAGFLMHPNIELGGNGRASDSRSPGSKGNGKSVDLIGSEWMGDERGKGFLNSRSGKKILKRGMDSSDPHDKTVENSESRGRNDDGSGSGLSMDDNGSAKRSRKSGKEEFGEDDSLVTSIDAVKSGSEFDGHTLTGPALHIDGSVFLGSKPAEEGDERGKRKFDGSGDLLSDVTHEAELGLESKTKNSANDAYNPFLQYMRRVHASRKNEMRERFRDIAKENAPRFAHFAPDGEDDQSSPAPEAEHEIDDCSAPFSAAMKIIKDRGKKSIQTGCVSAERNLPSVYERNHAHIGARFSVPSLQELCLKILANNADAIVSLDCVPDNLRHRLSQLLCDSRRMNNHFFELLVSGSPTEIRLRDCSWLTEEQFTKSFQTCDTANLVVLQLDQCGRCMPDYVVLATLAQSPRQLPGLTSLSLSGACRLSDEGLRALVSSAPVLRSINLSQCSLLTSAGLYILADSLGSLLKELYLDDCQNIDAALIVPALKELEHLEVLSVAGIQTVCDEFIKDYIIARGHNMKELVLKDCIKLTDASMKVIAEHCPRLCVLDLMNLCKLTDLSIGYLTNSCRALHTLRLCRNPFSDEAIAAFMETAGESLKELSLNNIKKVGHHTTLSLASHAKKLHTLDLSWCRNLTDNELGLIVDSCVSLRLLKLFGCTQVTDFFLGHSNPQIQIIGFKMSPVLQHVKAPDPHQGALLYSPVSVNLV